MTTRDEALVLVLSAEPEGTHPIRLGEEVRMIRLRLREAELRDRIRLVNYPATRLEDVMQGLNQYQPDVVHFSGHGTQSAELVLTAKDGGVETVGSDDLKSLFNVMGEGVKAVVLNSCFSDSQAKGIAEEVGIAVGMKGGIGIESAVEFSAAFYQGLGYGKSFLQSFRQGKLALSWQKVSDEHNPKIYTKGGVDAGQVVLFP